MNKPVERKRKRRSLLSKIFYQIFCILLAIPFGMIVGRFIPKIVLPVTENGIRLDGYVGIVIALVIIQFLLKPFRRFIGYFSLGVGIVLAVMVYRGEISKRQIQEVYLSKAAQIANHEVAGKSIWNQDEIRKTTRVTDNIREFVKMNAYSYGSDDKLLMAFSLFDAFSDKWDYESDPPLNDYVTPASVSIETMEGDCDDYSICLGTCLKSAGLRVRVVQVEWHLYPELYVGDEEAAQEITDMINLRYGGTRDLTIHFTKDERTGKFWLNMDYTARFPGGSFLGDHRFGKFEL